MKIGFKASLIVTALASGLIGATVQSYVMRPKIIENGAGHYNMLSGQFEWGKPPKIVEVSSATMDMTEQLTEYSKKAVK